MNEVRNAADHLPRECSVSACLKTLRYGLTRFEGRPNQDRWMERPAGDRMFREMMVSLVWLTSRAMGDNPFLSPRDIKTARLFGIGRIIHEIDLDAIRCREYRGWLTEVRVLRAGVSVLERAVARAMNTGQGWGLREGTWFGIEMALRLKRVAAQSEVWQEVEQEKLKKMLSRGLDDFETHERIVSSKQSKQAKRSAISRVGGAEGVAAIEAEQTVKVDIESSEYREFLARPHFGVIEGGRASIDDGDFNAFWQRVAPMVRDLGAALRMAPDDLLEMAHANVATTYLVTDGTARATAIMTACDLAMEGGKETVFVAFLANEVNWPDLSRLIISLKRASGEIGGLPVVLWGTSTLPQVPTFEAVEVPSLPGTGLIWRPEVALAA